MPPKAEQKSVAKLEKMLVDAIQEDFPAFKKVEVLNLESQPDKIVGLVRVDDKVVYGFVFEKGGELHPMLQRIMI